MTKRSCSLLAVLAAVNIFFQPGCGTSGGESPTAETTRVATEPSRAVAAAAKRTLEAGTRKLELNVESPTAQYSAMGLFEPSRGRFRVEAHYRQAPGLRSPQERKLVAVGINRRTTFQEQFSPFEGEKQRCWIEPHLPVGSNGATSVEESVRLVGATLEALQKWTANATARETGGSGTVAYAATLKPLPSPEREERQAASFRKGTDAAARLLGKLDGPIRVTVGEDGQIVELRLELRDYRPQALVLEEPDPERVSIEASLSDAESTLNLEQPECLGME